MALSSFQDFLCHRNITGGCHPRLWSVVSSRLLASRHELLFVRKTDRKGPKRKRENFPRTAIKQNPAGCFCSCGTESRVISLKHLHHAADAGDEGIHVLSCVVEREAGPAGSFDAEAMHEGLGTMVSGADGDAEAGEQGTHVEVVDERARPFQTSP